MFSHKHCINATNRLVKICGTSVLVAASIFTGSANGVEHQLSDKYSMHVDPAAKQQLGEQTYNEVMTFFQSAEKAIETKDMDSLMALYSDSYTDGEHDKSSARQIWEKIFSRFEKMAMHHNMKLAKASSDKNMVVFQCSGLLLGAPSATERPVTIDNWTNQDHVLVKEGGKWKLIGTYGAERKRLWFDKPMHPLF